MAGQSDAQNLQIRLTAQAETAMRTFVKLKGEILKTNKSLADMGMQVSKIGVKVGKDGLSEVTSEMEKIKTGTKGATRELKNMSNFGGGFGKLLLGLFTLRRVIQVLGRSFKEISDYAENFNLFNVSMGEMKDRGIEFQRAMTSAFNVDMSGTLRYQGFFQNLLTSLNVGKEEAYEMSEALTTLTYDMASLFNWSYDTAYQRLQSGIIGQTKPLRAAGVDVTQQTIQPILYELDIHKKVIELTQAEKVMLRYIAIMRQTGNAHGDYARTIESPANQIKVFKDQVAILHRWLGATFITLISKILPFINGFIMAISEVVKAIAILFGFNEEDFGDFGQGGGVDFMYDLEEGAKDATSAVGKLQGSLRKFDEINNISLRSSAGGSGAVGSLETQSKLMQEIARINEKLKQDFSQMKSKAEEVRDTIKQWLGLFFELDKETGIFTGKMTLLGKVILWLGGGLVLGKLIVGIGNTVAAFKGLKTMLIGASGTAGVVGAVGLLATGLIGLSTIGLVYFGVKSWQFIDQLKDKLTSAMPKLTDFEAILIRIAELFGVINKDKVNFLLREKDFWEHMRQEQYASSANRNMWLAQGVPLKQANFNQTVVVQVDGEKIATAVVNNVNNVANKTGNLGFDR